MTPNHRLLSRRFRGAPRLAGFAAGLLLAAGTAFAPLQAAVDTEDSAEAAAADAGDTLLIREGLRVKFEATPVAAGDDAPLMEGTIADISFRITDESTGEPVQGLYPAVWMDVATELNKRQGKDDERLRTCRQRVGTYLQGIVGVRPMIDLNSYFVLVMNQDRTITVIDPLVGITGITKLYALINLERPGADWDRSGDEKRLFVSMPIADKLAVVDLSSFKVIENVPAGDNPTRVRVQPDDQYIWVGNNAEEGKPGGVTVLRTSDLEMVAQIETGPGHHEIAFSDDSRFAFVSNRLGGTVSIIDVAKLEKVSDVETGPLPISLDWSSQSGMLYVADGQAGTVTVIDGRSLAVEATLELTPGLGPLRFSQDGRWGITVNPSTDTAHIIDAATNTVAHDVSVGPKPFHVAFSRAFAYIRSLGTERVAMMELALFGKDEAPPMITWAAGAKPPGTVADVSIADAVVEAPGEAAVLVTSPGDNTVYYYMEGMNAATGNFRNYGHRPRAVTVADRTLKEHEPGVYSAKALLPAPGTYDVAFVMDTPRLLHCFSVDVAVDPRIVRDITPLEVEYLAEDRRVQANTTVPFRFRLVDTATDAPRSDLEDVSVLFYRAPGTGRTEVAAEAVAGEDGVYEARLPIERDGVYYVYVGTSSGGIRYADLPFMSLRAVRDLGAAAATE